MLTQKKLKERLHYCPNTGDFTWTSVIPYGYRAKVGEKAGSLSHQGYWTLRIYGKWYSAHRIAFLYMTGSMPAEDVDHINHNRSDNRWKNIRVVPRSENCKNMSITKANNSGFTGVSWRHDTSKWRAYITISRKKICLGSFEGKSDAIAARKAANIKYGYHPNHGAI